MTATPNATALLVVTDKATGVVHRAAVADRQATGNDTYLGLANNVSTTQGGASSSSPCGSG